MTRTRKEPLPAETNPPCQPRPPLTSIGWWLGLLAVTGCTPTLQPMGAAWMPAMISEDAVITGDGYRLPLRVWRPDGAITAVVLALHGFNDYSNAYANVGPTLARHGIHAYAYDQRGFGATLQHGIWPGGSTLISDLETVTALLLRRHPGVPLYLLGESMGGAVVITALARPLPPDSPLSRVAGTVLVAPAVWGHRAMAPPLRLALWLTNALLPGITMSAPRELNIRPSDNIEMLRAYSRDPLVIKATRVDTMNGLVELMGDALEAAPDFHTPALILYGVHEQILPRAAVARMLKSLPNDHQRIAVYPNGWHMMLRDRQGEAVIVDIISWLKAPEAPLPSGADLVPYTRIASD
ncbi:MAG: lysophospholipase [Rhodospirillaceae bacterium]